MRLECTKKLLDYLGELPEQETAPETDPLFTWAANLIVLNRRKTLVMVNSAARCIVLLHGITARDRSKLPELLREGIRQMLESEFVSPKIIEQYLCDCGELTIAPNSSRAQVALCNRACMSIKQYGDCLEPGDLYQRLWLPCLNNDLVTVQKKLFFRHELLLQSLRERYGGEVVSCKAIELNVSLELDTPCTRTVIVPEALSFYQLHCVMQALFNWEDCHLHQFAFQQGRSKRDLVVIAPDLEASEDEFSADGLDSITTTIGEIFRKRRTVLYEYDFGDGWTHIIKAVKFLPDWHMPHPVCTALEGIAPVEDCGGPYGFQRLREALADPDDPEHEDIAEWMGYGELPVPDPEKINRKLKFCWRFPVPLYDD